MSRELNSKQSRLFWHGKPSVAIDCTMLVPHLTFSSHWACSFSPTYHQWTAETLGLIISTYIFLLGEVGEGLNKPSMQAPESPFIGKGKIPSKAFVLKTIGARDLGENLHLIFLSCGFARLEMVKQNKTKKPTKQFQPSRFFLTD